MWSIIVCYRVTTTTNVCLSCPNTVPTRPIWSRPRTSAMVRFMDISFHKKSKSKDFTLVKCWSWVIRGQDNHRYKTIGAGSVLWAFIGRVYWPCSALECYSCCAHLLRRTCQASPSPSTQTLGSWSSPVAEFFMDSFNNHVLSSLICLPSLLSPWSYKGSKDWVRASSHRCVQSDMWLGSSPHGRGWFIFVTGNWFAKIFILNCKSNMLMQFLFETVLQVTRQMRNPKWNQFWASFAVRVLVVPVLV